MKIKYHIFFLLLLSETLFAMPAQILLMRHGEKPVVGNELSEQGWLRAKALPQLFLDRAEFQRYGLPVALYAMSPNKEGGSLRAIQTLKYVSKQLNLPMETDFTRDQVDELINNIKNNKSYDNKMIVICWEHKVLVKIANRLGLNEVSQWPSEQFDRIWSLNFSPEGTLTGFKNLPEKLLPTDSQE